MSALDRGYLGENHLTIFYIASVYNMCRIYEEYDHSMHMKKQLIAKIECFASANVHHAI